MKKRIFILTFIFLCLYISNISYAKTLPNWATGKKIAHAGGGINKTSYTNSIEALTQTLNNNNNVVELDFMFTSDGTLVCIHNWKDINGKKLDIDTFLNSKIKKNYTPMTAETAINMLIEAGNTYLVVDTKEKDVPKVYQTINKICLDYDIQKNQTTEEAVIDDQPITDSTIDNSQCTKGNDFRKKIIPQIYSQKEYKQIRKIYKYKNWIFTLYKLKINNENDIKSLASFCKKYKISTVTIPKKLAIPSYIKIIKNKKLSIATHTVNTTKEWKKYKKLGIDIIYTDFLI